MSSNSTDNMNNLERWVYGIPLPDITSYELLKQEVYEHAKKDYVFFLFLIGYVNRYLEGGITENFRNCVFQLLYDLLIENKVVILFIEKNTLKAAHWNNTDDIKQIIEKIRSKWEMAGTEELEMNDIIWLTTPSDLEIKDEDGQVIIKFYDFKKRSVVGNPVFIDLSIEIKMENAVAQEATTIELTSFEKFMKDLKQLDETLKQTFYFKHVDEQLQINFKPQITGSIQVEGFLQDNQHLNKFDFSFAMPSVELSPLSRQIESVMEVLS